MKIYDGIFGHAVFVSVEFFPRRYFEIQMLSFQSISRCELISLDGKSAVQCGVKEVGLQNEIVTFATIMRVAQQLIVRDNEATAIL